MSAQPGIDTVKFLHIPPYIFKRDIIFIQQFFFTGTMAQLYFLVHKNVSMVKPGPKAVPKILAGAASSRSSRISFNTNKTVGDDILPYRLKMLFEKRRSFSVKFNCLCMAVNIFLPPG